MGIFKILISRVLERLCSLLKNQIIKWQRTPRFQANSLEQGKSQETPFRCRRWDWHIGMRRRPPGLAQKEGKKVTIQQQFRNRSCLGFFFFLLCNVLQQEYVRFLSRNGCREGKKKNNQQDERKCPQAAPGELEVGRQEEFHHGKDCQALEGAAQRGLKFPPKVSKE